MKFQSKDKRRRDAEISLVPLIDLFLNILVFFLVTTSFSQDSVFFVELPETKASGPGDVQQQIVVAIDQDGRIAYEEQIIDLAALVAKVDLIASEKRVGTPVLVRADQSARHGAVVAVLDVFRNAGFSNLGLMTKTQRE